MTSPDTYGVGVTRRGLLRCGVGLGGAAALAGRTAAQETTDDGNGGANWPELNADPGNTGHHPAATTLGGVELDWTFDAAGPVKRPPTVHEGTVYAGTEPGTLHAIDAASGEEDWSFSAGDTVRTAPAVHDGTVYAGSDDGNVYAFDAASGEEVWRVESDDWAQASPTVVDGVVVAGTISRLFAADAASGEVLWRNGSGAASPAVADGRVFARDSDGVLALDLADGTELWRRSLPGDEGGMAVSVADGRVVVPYGDRGVYALDAASGDERWTFDGDGKFTPPVSVADGTAYAATWDGIYLYAIDAATGQEKWSQEVGSSVLSAPIPAGDEVVVATDELRGYDRETGEPRWSWKNVGSRGGIVVLDGRCYVGDELDGAIHALDGAPSSGSQGLPGFGVGTALAAVIGGAWLRRRVGRR